MSQHTKISFVAAAAIMVAVSFAVLPAQASQGRPHEAGAVYVLSNQPAGNAVITYHRARGRERSTRPGPFPPGEPGPVRASARRTPSSSMTRAGTSMPSTPVPTR